MTAVASVTPSEALRPQDLTLTLLGDYVAPSPHPIWSGGLVALLAGFGFSPDSARVALSRLGRRGLLTRTKSGRLAYYALTARAERVLEEGTRRIFSFGRDDGWDGTWTWLSYSIPEELRAERERLRARLAFLGFGSVHDGQWFAPRTREDELAALVDDLGLAAHVEVFVGRPSRYSRLAQLVERAWDLDGLDARYGAFVAEFGRYVKARTLDDRTAFVVRTLAMHRYRRFPRFDPELPTAVRARPGLRDDAIATFGELWERLEAPARHHFVTTVQTPA